MTQPVELMAAVDTRGKSNISGRGICCKKTRRAPCRRDRFGFISAVTACASSFFYRFLSLFLWEIAGIYKRFSGKKDSAERVQRGLLRHVVWIVDASQSMADKDMKPTYWECLYARLVAWLPEFFDQNPIAQVAILFSSGGKAKIISPFSGT
jgi:hypothetical protein